MGDRYILEIACPKCGHYDDDVGFAPTCGLDEWKCPKCEHVIDLCKETGISYEDASNAREMQALVDEILAADLGVFEEEDE